MSTLNTRISRLEASHGPQVLGRWILLGGDPAPSDEAVADLLVSQGIRRQRTDIVCPGHDDAPKGTPISLIEIIQVTQSFEEMLSQLGLADG